MVTSWKVVGFVCLCLVLSLARVNTNENVTTLESISTDSPTTTDKFVEPEVTDEEEEEDNCDGRLSSFVRRFDAKALLPDDYDQVVEEMHQKDIYQPFEHLNQSLAIAHRLFQYGQKLRNNKDIEATIMYLSSVLMDNLYAAQISTQCSADIVNVFNAMRNRELWALKFPDSFATPLQSGLLRGHISSFGEYDQCIGIKSGVLDSGRHIYGQYCQVQFHARLPSLDSYNSTYEQIIRGHPLFSEVVLLARKYNFDNFLNGNLAKMMIEGANGINNNLYHYGVCFPHSCTPDDIEKMFNEVIYPIIKIPVRVEKRLCDTHKDIKHVKLDGQQLTAIISISVLSSLVLLSSIYHLYLIYVKDVKYVQKQVLISSKDCNNNGKEHDCLKKSSTELNGKIEPFVEISSAHPSRTISEQFILSFSAIKNTNELLKVNNRFGVLDTIRLVLTFFVYALQAFHFTAGFTAQMLRSLRDTVPYEMAHSNAYWFARTPGVWIDGFMFTLGVILVLSQFRRFKDSNGQFSYFTYIWKRWYRLSIAMVGTFFIIFLYPLIGDGPIWFINDQWLMPPCKETSSIISSFLYYSNWNAAIGNYSIHATFPICNPPTWFLSMSTQLYILAPLVFVPLYRWPRYGFCLMILVVLLSPLSTLSPRIFLGHPTYVEGTKLKSISQGVRAFLNYHTNTVQYVTTLSIGMLTGCLIYSKPKMQIIGGRISEFVLWIASFSSIVLIFVWNNTFWELNKVNSEFHVLSWFVVSKFVIGSALGYITFMCCTGRGGVVNRIVTMPLLQPIAKLSYGIYLLRVPTIFYRVTSKRHTYEMHYYQTFQHIIIDFFITTGLAYLLHLLFESPSSNIMKIFEGDQIYRYFGQSDKQVKAHQNGNGDCHLQVENTTKDVESSADCEKVELQVTSIENEPSKEVK